jgi:phage tail-like protein
MHTMFGAPTAREPKTAEVPAPPTKEAETPATVAPPVEVATPPTEAAEHVEVVAPPVGEAEVVVVEVPEAPPEEPPAYVPLAVDLPPPVPPAPPRPTYPMPRPEGPRSRYLRYLPGLYQENEFLSRYLLIMETIWEPLEQREDHIGMYFDPRTTPAPFLGWLGSWLDLALNAHWPESRRRRLLEEAMDLYRWRGTSYGLTRMIEVCTGLTPEVVDLSSDGDGSRLQPFVFRVRLTIPPGSGVDRDLIESLVQAHKPAHAGYLLEVKP